MSAPTFVGLPWKKRITNFLLATSARALRCAFVAAVCMSSKFYQNPFIVLPLVAGVVLPCAAFIVWHFSRAAAQSPLVLKDAVYISGQPLPGTELLELNGERFSPEILRTGKVLLVFVTTDCKPCRDELTMLTSIESRTVEKLQVIAIGIESLDALSKFIQANNFRTRTLHDKDAMLMKSLSVRYFPSKFLVVDGLIVKTWFGNSRSESDLLKEVGL